MGVFNGWCNENIDGLTNHVEMIWSDLEMVLWPFSPGTLAILDKQHSAIQIPESISWDTGIKYVPNDPGLE